MRCCKTGAAEKKDEALKYMEKSDLKEQNQVALLVLLSTFAIFAS